MRFALHRRFVSSVTTSLRRRELVLLLVLVALATVAAARWTSPVQWKPDSLFYQAHVYQIEGDSHAVAYRKVFEGPLGLPRRLGESGFPMALRRVGNPAWVRYSERFYERRWFVPAVAALETAAAAGALLTLERSLRWLALWVPALAALSLTRDSSAVLGLAALWLALRERTRASFLLVVFGALAALPAPLFLGAAVREAMAYTFGAFYEPRDASWGWVAANYWPHLRPMVRNNLTYLQTHPFTAAYLVGGYLALFLVRSHGDRFVRFFRAAAVGSILLDALQPNYTEFRLELTFVPIAAAGLAVGVTSLKRGLVDIRQAGSTASP
jgi:hypothetical protein